MDLRGEALLRLEVMRAWVECRGDERRGLFLAWAVFLGDFRLLGLFFHTGELCT